MKCKIGMLAGIALLVTAGAASADTIDPLHGEVCATASTCTNAGDNGTNTPINQSSGTVPTFGFAVSPTGTGTLELLILTPNNDGIVSDSITGNGFTSATSIGTSLGVWNSGTLAGFLGISASPDNPIGAYLPSAQLLDPGATGFNVYRILDTASFTLPDPGSGQHLPDEFDLTGALPVGSYITAFFNEGSNGMIADANSGALFVNTQGIAAVPGPIVGAGLPGVIAGCIALFGLQRRRRAHQALGLA